MQLQLHYTNYTIPQLQLPYTTTTTTAALQHTTSGSCGWGDRPGDHCNDCNQSTKHSSNHLSVHQWIRSAIRDSQQPSSPIGFLFLKLPPPPCAVLLVYLYIYFILQSDTIVYIYVYIYIYTLVYLFKYVNLATSSPEMAGHRKTSLGCPDLALPRTDVTTTFQRPDSLANQFCETFGHIFCEKVVIHKSGQKSWDSWSYTNMDLQFVALKSVVLWCWQMHQCDLHFTCFEEWRVLYDYLRACFLILQKTASEML